MNRDDMRVICCQEAGPPVVLVVREAALEDRNHRASPLSSLTPAQRSGIHPCGWSPPDTPKGFARGHSLVPTAIERRARAWRAAAFADGQAQFG